MSLWRTRVVRNMAGARVAPTKMRVNESECLQSSSSLHAYAFGNSYRLDLPFLANKWSSEGHLTSISDCGTFMTSTLPPNKTPFLVSSDGFVAKSDVLDLIIKELSSMQSGISMIPATSIALDETQSNADTINASLALIADYRIAALERQVKQLSLVPKPSSIDGMFDMESSIHRLRHDLILLDTSQGCRSVLEKCAVVPRIDKLEMLLAHRLESIKSELEHARHNETRFLEKVIIFLIAVEVAFATRHCFT